MGRGFFRDFLAAAYTDQYNASRSIPRFPKQRTALSSHPLVNIHMQGLKVLIVEDDGDLRGLYCFLLANEGCQVRAVRNGLEAITEIESNRPDIVVTDIAMPVFGGLDLIKTIRADEDLADLPVLAMTNFAEHFHERALEVGADKAIGKPNEVEILREAIQSVLLRSQT
ncbi:MAG TPA: response regulator [Blastocatellia bacterium]